MQCSGGRVVQSLKEVEPGLLGMMMMDWLSECDQRGDGDDDLLS